MLFYHEDHEEKIKNVCQKQEGLVVRCPDQMKLILPYGKKNKTKEKEFTSEDAEKNKRQR